MKLFSIPDVNKEKNNKQADSIAEIAYLEVTFLNLQKRINIENDNFTKRMEEQRAIYFTEKNKLQEEIRDLESKVRILKLERQEQMVPVVELKMEAVELLTQLKERDKDIKKREEELEEIEETYKERIDDLGIRMDVIKEKEHQIESQLKGIKEEREIISEGHRKLNKAIEEHNIGASKKERELAEKELALTIIEKDNRNYIEDMKKEFFEKARANKDRSESLERGFKELEKLKDKLNKTNICQR